MKHGDMSENFIIQDGCDRKWGDGQFQIKRGGGEKQGQVRRQ